MSEEEKTATSTLPIGIGVLCTLLVFLLFAKILLISRCELLPSQVLECRSNWEWFLDSRPNEVGDALAGFSASLAFVWIIVTVFLQTVELRAQREELKLTRAEFKEMSNSLQRQANAMDEEKSMYSEKRYHNLLNQEILSIIKDYNAMASRCIWVGPPDAYGNGPSHMLTIVESPDSWKKSDVVLACISSHLEALLNFDFDQPPWCIECNCPSRPSELDSILKHALEMQNSENYLSIGNKGRLSRMELPRLIGTVEALLKSKSHWMKTP